MNSFSSHLLPCSQLAQSLDFSLTGRPLFVIVAPNSMKLTFIGMSNTGKTHWSKKLERMGFVRFCCDDLIEERLEKELKRQGYRGIADVAKWMGQPYETRYGKTSKQYLAAERETMNYVLKLVDALALTTSVVIDTTGSVIYHGDRILNALKKRTTVVYLETPASVQKEMHQLYLKDPKPVIWGKSFKKTDQETDTDALARCYPQLLAYRTRRYEGLADITLDYFMLRQKHLTPKILLQLISQ